MPAAEDVERQVAVGVVVAVEEAALLVPVQGHVGGVEIEDDLPGRRLAVASRKRSTKGASIAAASWPMR
jgi:hypothetical protein